MSSSSLSSLPPQGPAGVVSGALILVLVPAPVTNHHASGTAIREGSDPTILGLSLAQRTVFATQRAGFGPVFYLAPHGVALPGITPIANWSDLESVVGTIDAASLVVAPATVLAEASWLEPLTRTQLATAAWAAVPDRVVMLSATPAALAALSAAGGARSLRAVQDRLLERYGPAAKFSDDVDPMILGTSGDIRAAQRRLLRTLVKESDGFMAKHVERPISLSISRFLASTPVTPNQMTLISIAIGLAGAPFFLSGLWPLQTAGALLFLAHSILDGCDGELARLKFQESRWGGILDFWGDNIVHSVIFACMAAGWARAAAETWPWLLGAAAVLGTLASAGFVYWRVMRPKNDTGPLYTSVSASPNDWLTRLLDALSRRDFIYLVVVFALFGKASWLLVLTAVGAPTFFLLLVLVAAREWAMKASKPSAA